MGAPPLFIRRGFFFIWVSDPLQCYEQIARWSCAQHIVFLPSRVPGFTVGFSTGESPLFNDVLIFPTVKKSIHSFGEYPHRIKLNFFSSLNTCKAITYFYLSRLSLIPSSLWLSEYVCTVSTFLRVNWLYPKSFVVISRISV